MVGYTLSLAAKPLMALAGSWEAVFAARFADRFGKGIRTAPRDALIADSVDVAHRGDAFGFQRASDTLGAFLGSALAIGVVYMTQQQAELLHAGDLRHACLALDHPIAIAVLVLVFGLQEIHKPPPAGAPNHG